MERGWEVISGGSDGGVRRTPLRLGDFGRRAEETFGGKAADLGDAAAEAGAEDAFRTVVVVDRAGADISLLEYTLEEVLAMELEVDGRLSDPTAGSVSSDSTSAAGRFIRLTFDSSSLATSRSCSFLCWRLGL